MKDHQKAVEEYLDKFAEEVDRWIMVSITYANMGTYHLMSGDKRVRSIDFRYSNNHMEWGQTKDGGLFHDADAKLYSVVTQWDKLLSDLCKWVQPK